jgi:hypothetical protein
LTHHSGGHGILLDGRNQLQYITLALGSALVLFLFPHTLTGALAARSRNTIKRTMVGLPAYLLVLGLFLLLGYAAIAAHTTPIVNAATGQADTNTIIPVLFEGQFPAWFAGIALAAIGIGALVPAAIMSIAASHLWTRNVYKTYLRPDATQEQETKQAKIASLVVKFGAIAPDRADQATVLPRSPADRRRDHPSDIAHGGNRALHSLVPRRRTDRRLGGRLVVGPKNALQHSQPNHRCTTLRWHGTRAKEAIDSTLESLPHLHRPNLPWVRRACWQPCDRHRSHHRTAPNAGRQRHRPD